MSLVEHARTELELLGQFEEDPAFSQSLVAAVAAFASYGHSGGSASVAIPMLNELLQYKNLSPLTDNPDEWMDVSEQSGYTFYQNRRNSGAFSKDGGRSYYLLENRVYEADNVVLDVYQESVHVEVEAEEGGG